MNENININVLLIEDDIIDVKYIKRGFEKYEIKNTLTVVSDPVEALNRIYGKNNIPKIIEPDLVILDVSMPKMSGIEFLKILRADPQFEHLPVVILSSSNSERDMKSAQQLNVLGYFLKPLDFKSFLLAYHRIVEKI